MASIYAGIPLLLDHPAGGLDAFLSRHLSLEQLNLFGPMSATNDSRQNGQGGNSHVMGLPVPNWPPAPKLKLNTLYWPTGASRFAHFLALVDDPTLEAILSQTENIPAPPATKTIIPNQLVICEGGHGSTPSANGFSIDSTDARGTRTALSVEMWPLTPRKLVGTDSFGPNDVNSSKRLWILPLVDIRYFWQTMPTPSWLYSNVKVTSGTSIGLYDIEFVGVVKRKNLALMTVGPVDSSYTPTPTLTSDVDGSGTENEKQKLDSKNPASIKYHKITFQPPVPPEGGALPATEQTDKIPSDAMPEEIEDALNALPSLRVTWQTLINNLELIVEPLDASATAKSLFKLGPDATPPPKVAAEWGWPDKTELDRRHESVAMVLDAVAQSVGRRVVRDVTGTIRIEDAKWAKDLYSYNLDPHLAGGGYTVIAGGESLQYSFNSVLPPPAGIRNSGPCGGSAQYTWDATAAEWNLTANTCGSLCTPDTPPSRPGSSEGQVVTRRCVQMPGPYVPAAVDVIMRDLTRSSKSGSFIAYSGTPTSGDWNSDAGFLVASVPAATAIDDHAEATWSLIAPADVRQVLGWKRTIHTPTLSNKGTISATGDNYSKLALVIAGSVYDWLAYVFDWDFSSVQRWWPTGFDDYCEWSVGQRLADGSYRAETRIQSVPPNFGVSHMLIQIGTQCPWTEDCIHGEIREFLDMAVHPRLDASKVRAWVFLPPMELQGEDAGKLRTHKRAVTLTLRSNDAEAAPNTYFEAHSWFGENLINWMDCDPYCAPLNDDGSLPGGTCEDATCESAFVDGHDVCVDNGTMSL